MPQMLAAVGARVPSASAAAAAAAAACHLLAAIGAAPHSTAWLPLWPHQQGISTGAGSQQSQHEQEQQQQQERVNVQHEAQQLSKSFVSKSLDMEELWFSAVGGKLKVWSARAHPELKVGVGGRASCRTHACTHRMAWHGMPRRWPFAVPHTPCLCSAQQAHSALRPGQPTPARTAAPPPPPPPPHRARSRRRWTSCRQTTWTPCRERPLGACSPTGVGMLACVPGQRPQQRQRQPPCAWHSLAQPHPLSTACGAAAHTAMQEPYAAEAGLPGSSHIQGAGRGCAGEVARVFGGVRCCQHRCAAAALRARTRTCRRTATRHKLTRVKLCMNAWSTLLRRATRRRPRST
jgi:Spy/CpxP family protein refolding chaperone